MEVIVLDNRIRSNWIETVYDIQCRYGYETMLQVLDSISEEYEISLEIVSKAHLAGASGQTVWKKMLFNKPRPLSKMASLNEECGEVSIGGRCALLSLSQVYITMFNQTSIITIQVPNELDSNKVQESKATLATAIQSKVVSLL